ncbi:DUF1501 domain-containing protein [Marinicellulosiphila megalodicopiae]|uniref:DUF1501 domain-containing protein n=1 Tax=Marinicellulosiphila megalodicopiae TaxID=2724896 RepID=UPI003BAF2CE5
MKKLTSRRALLKAMSAQGGLWTTRSFATGLPMGVLLGAIPSDEAIAATIDHPQYLMMALSHFGEPINNNCPGVYDTGLDGVHHNTQPSMVAQNVELGSGTYRAAKPWADLQKSVPWAMDRMSFIHHDTRTNIHAQYSGVMKLMGSSRGPNSETNSPEFLPSILSAALQPIHQTIQAPPLYLGGPEVDFEGQAIGQINPSSMKTLFPSFNNRDQLIREMRDADLMALNEQLKKTGTRKQKAWLDDQVQSLVEVRKLNEELIAKFSEVKYEDKNLGLIDASIIAFKLNMTSVVTLNLNFGGDNHIDPGLLDEANGTVQSCKEMVHMFESLKTHGMEDKVTFAACGVFGRTLRKVKNGDGRDHNLHHHVTVLAGKNVKSGVIGGLREFGGDFGAMPINSTTGAGDMNGDIPLDESLESVAKTIGAACGLKPYAMNRRIKRAGADGDSNVGKIITAAIVS